MEELKFGSYNLGEVYVKELSELIQKSKINNVNSFVESISRAGRDLIKQQPNMVVIRKRITAVVYYLKRLSKSGKTVDQVKQLAMEKIAEVHASAKINADKIADIGSRLVLAQSKILTFGYSTNVVNILKKAYKLKRKFTVYCLEGRPNYSGKLLAEELAAKGIQVTLLTDAGMAWASGEANMILIGADRVYESGIITQTGGLPLIVTAHHFKIPVYVACELDKIMSEQELAVRFYQQDKDKVIARSKKTLSAINYNFESVPLELISKFVCEEGVFDITEYKSWFLKE